MRAIFMGTPDFGIPTLTEMIKSDFIEVVAVISQPDKPKGRGKKLQFTPIKEVAVEHNIEVFQPEKIKTKESIDKIKEYNVDVIVVVAYGQILPKELIDLPKHGCINVHGSLLPKYRGAAPIHKAIIDGEEETGITIMYMDVGLDTGDMILKKSIKIGDDDTTGDIYEKLSVIGGKALVEALNNINKNIITREKQDDELSSYAHLLNKKDGIINWNKTSVEIKNHVRGLTPWPNAFTYLNNVAYKILSVELCEEKKVNAHIGEIISIEKNGIVVKTADSSVMITRLQKQGSKAMSAGDFLRGNTINIGDKFTEENNQ